MPIVFILSGFDLLFFFGSMEHFEYKGKAFFRHDQISQQKTNSTPINMASEPVYRCRASAMEATCRNARLEFATLFNMWFRIVFTNGLARRAFLQTSGRLAANERVLEELQVIGNEIVVGFDWLRNPRKGLKMGVFRGLKWGFW